MNTKQKINPVVVDTTKSNYAKLKPVSINSVHLTDKFWQTYRQINRNVMLPAQYRLCEETGRIDNFRRAAGKIDGPFKGMFFNDSDVYKWLEAAAWSLATDPDVELQSLVDHVIDEIAAAQQPDGYLDTYFMHERADQRWTNFDLHEMYCAGHLFQAAIAYTRSTGKTSLLEISIRFANYLCDRFGREEDGKIFGLDGHPEIEMALVELYRMTGQQQFLDLCQFFMDARGYERLDAVSVGRQSSYYQDRIPFRDMKRLEGHSVRATYLNCGGADLYAETGEKALKAALDAMWESMVMRQMYLTGGLGSRYEIEGFGTDYELPNGRAHTETCAGVGNFMWNWRMLLLSGESRFADVMELALYNAILPGISLDGTSYFYQNPLSDDGNHRRERWFTVACCPSNVSRTLATLPGYFYSTSSDGIWIHHYATSEADLNLMSDDKVHIAQHTDYPWSGNIRFEIQAENEFSLFLRKPGWCKAEVTLTLNGTAIEPRFTNGGYIQIERQWEKGDIVELAMPMPVRLMESHPFVVDNQGRVAIMRGPLVYCLESVDHSSDVRLISLSESVELKPEFHSDLLGGVTALHGQGTVLADINKWDNELYKSIEPRIQPLGRAIPILAIPYFGWANRTPGSMQVWLRIDSE